MMAEGSNILIIFFCINIMLYVGLTGIGSDKGNLVKDDLFSNSGFLAMSGDKIDLGETLKEKPELQSSNVLSDVMDFKVFDALSIVWDFIMSLLNIITLPFTLMYNLFIDAKVIGRMVSLLIMAPLCMGYIYAILSFIKGVGS